MSSYNTVALENSENFIAIALKSSMMGSYLWIK